MKRAAFVSVLAFLIIMSGAGASSLQINQSIKGFLQIYIPNSTIGNSTYYGVVSGNTTYIAMQTSAGFILINTTKPYSILTNYSRAYPVLGAFFRTRYYLNSTLLGNLSSVTGTYEHQITGSVKQCFIDLGLNNASYLGDGKDLSCYNVQSCYLTIANASEAPFISQGIVNLSDDYYAYNNSYKALQSIVPQINQGNSYLYISQIINDVNELIAFPYSQIQNPLFNVPANISSQGLLANCPIFPTYQTLVNSPWYCKMLGQITGCGSISLNRTLIGDMRTIVSQLNAIPISNASVSAATKTSAALAYSYVEPVFVKINTAIYLPFVNYTTPRYHTAINASNAISSKVSNSSLASLTANLTKEFASIIASGINQNVSQSNKSIAPLMAKVDALSASLSASYYASYNQSVKNSALLLTAQLNNPDSQAATVLAARQEKINAQFSKPVTYAQLSGINANLSTISANATKVSSAPFSMGAFVKSTDEWFAAPLAAAIPGSIQSKIAASPSYAALLSLIIGLVLLFIVYYFTYRKLNRKGRLLKSPSVKRSWITLFEIFFVLVLIYAYVTYAYAAQANATLPLSGFLASVNSHPTIAIALSPSASSNLTVSQCVTSVKSALTAMHKTAEVIIESNYVCNVVNSTSLPSTNCFNQLLSSGTPTIVIAENGTNAISYSGFYGTVLYASGSAASGSSCYLASILK